MSAYVLTTQTLAALSQTLQLSKIAEIKSIKADVYLPSYHILKLEQKHCGAYQQNIELKDKSKSGISTAWLWYFIVLISELMGRVKVGF